MENNDKTIKVVEKYGGWLLIAFTCFIHLAKVENIVKNIKKLKCILFQQCLLRDGPSHSFLLALCIKLTRNYWFLNEFSFFFASCKPLIAKTSESWGWTWGKNYLHIEVLILFIVDWYSHTKNKVSGIFEDNLFASRKTMRSTNKCIRGSEWTMQDNEIIIEKEINWNEKEITLSFFDW